MLNPLTGKLVYLKRGCERLTRLRRGASKASSSNAGKSNVGEGDREGVILDDDVAAGLLLLAVVIVVVLVVVAAAAGDNELLLPLDLPDTCLRLSSSTDRFPVCRGFFDTRLASSDDARLESLIVSFLLADADAVALVLVDDDASAGVVVVAAAPVVAVAVAGVVVVLVAGESCADGCIQEYFFCDRFLKKALLLLVPSPMVVC